MKLSRGKRSPSEGSSQRDQTADPLSASPGRLIRFKELREMIPLSRTSVWRGVNAGTFPRPCRLSENVVAWKENEIVEWMNERERS